MLHSPDETRLILQFLCQYAVMECRAYIYDPLSNIYHTLYEPFCTLADVYNPYFDYSKCNAQQTLQLFIRFFVDFWKVLFVASQCHTYGLKVIHYYIEVKSELIAEIIIQPRSLMIRLKYEAMGVLFEIQNGSYVAVPQGGLETGDTLLHFLWMIRNHILDGQITLKTRRQTRSSSISG